MPKINVLPRSVAELIAAGEVVERPASVIKELAENSIDAGATSITVEIRNGGVTFMRITDNGCGIDREDVPLAFLSHATSKLKTAEDLDGIFTLGFRGEALASVASVARVEVMTRAEGNDIGTRYCIEGGEEMLCDDAGCPLGTTIVVRDLFFNTPARMKFMKKDVTEANAVASVVDILALSHPHISFRFIRDGKQTLVTSGDGKLDSTVRSVLGREIADGFLPVTYELNGVTVSGAASKPAASRATRSMQFFFLNGRYVKSRTAIAALEEAYKGTVMVGKFPACVLNIGVEARTVDVNVHPAKTEVRFSDERKIFSAVYYAVKSAVTSLDVRPKAGFAKPVPAQPRQPETVQIKMAEKSADFWQRMSADTFASKAETQVQASASAATKPVSVKPYVAQPQSAVQQASPVSASTVTLEQITPSSVLVPPQEAELQQVAEALPKLTVTQIISPDSNEAENTPQLSAPVKQHAFPEFVDEDKAEMPIRVIGEAFKTYIIVEQGEKLIVIDKHAAHERILYEKLKTKTDGSTQVLMSPVTVTLSKKEYSAVIENLPLLEKSGYAVDDFGSGTVIVRECPMYIDYDEIPQLIGELAGYLLSGRTSLETEKLDWLLHNSACRAAVKAGDKTSLAELQSFAEALIKDGSIRYCPHGRPVSFEITRREMEKQFGRIQ